MVHQCQRLPLGLEPGDDILGVHAELDDLERDAAMNGFLLLGHVNHATTAFADLLEQFVAAYLVAGFFGGQGSDADDFAWRNSRRAFEEDTRFFTGLQQFFDTPAQCGVVSAGFVKIGGTLTGRQLPGTVKDGHFAIWRICHVRWHYSLLSNAKIQSKRRRKKTAPDCLRRGPGNLASPPTVNLFLRLKQ
jgi:hypothetical protein